MSNCAMSDARLTASGGRVTLVTSFLLATLSLSLPSFGQDAGAPPPPRPCKSNFVDCVPPLDLPGDEPGQPVNWNPGVYFGIKPGQFEDDNGGWKPASTVLGNNAMCKPGGENVKGIRLKLEWGLYEQSLGDYSHGDALIDDVVAYLGSGQCGGVPRQTSIQTDFLANKREARAGWCVPLEHRNAAGMVSWANAGGRDRCAARLWDASNQTLRDYKRLWQHIAQRYGDSPFVERFSPKGEGALGVQKYDDSYSNYDTLTLLKDMALGIRADAPRIAATLGTNNFQSGADDLIISVYKVAMDASGGMGLSWPDTFTERVAPATRHAAYYNQFHNDHMMWGEWQFPETRFNSFDDVHEVCCDPTFKDERADGNAFFPPNPPNHAYGATHVVVITTSADYPEEDALEMFDRRGYHTYDMSCPDMWKARGLTCVDNTGAVVP